MCKNMAQSPKTTGQHVPATIIGPSHHGDNYIYLRHMRNGKEIEHNAAFHKLLVPICSPSPSAYEGSPPRGRSMSRSASAPVHANPAPAAALPIGPELATTKDGIPYYMDHTRGITTWGHPELPPFPSPPSAAKAVKPADK